MNDTKGEKQKEVIKRNGTNRKTNDLPVVHLHNQLDSVQCWQVVVLKSLEIKNKTLTECHVVPYSAHPGVLRTLNKVRHSFYCKRQTGDIRTFVDNSKICLTEKSDHSLPKGKL